MQEDFSFLGYYSVCFDKVRDASSFIISAGGVILGATGGGPAFGMGRSLPTIFSMLLFLWWIFGFGASSGGTGLAGLGGSMRLIFGFAGSAGGTAAIGEETPAAEAEVAAAGGTVGAGLVGTGGLETAAGPLPGRWGTGLPACLGGGDKSSNEPEVEGER